MLLREYRAVVEYDDDADEHLIYGPDLDEGAEARAMKAARAWSGRDFEGSVVTVEGRDVGPWETVRSIHTPDRTPPHPGEQEEDGDA